MNPYRIFIVVFMQILLAFTIYQWMTVQAVLQSMLKELAKSCPDDHAYASRPPHAPSPYVYPSSYEVPPLQAPPVVYVPEDGPAHAAAYVPEDGPAHPAVYVPEDGPALPVVYVPEDEPAPPKEKKRRSRAE